MPSQKFGVDRPQSANPLAAASHAVPRPTAEMMPAGMPIASAITIVSVDVLQAVIRKPAPADRAGPHVSPMPIPHGGGVSLSGQF